MTNVNQICTSWWCVSTQQCLWRAALCLTDAPFIGSMEWASWQPLSRALPFPGTLQSCSSAEGSAGSWRECFCNLFCCFLQQNSPLYSEHLTLGHEFLLCWALGSQELQGTVKERVEFKGLQLNVCVALSCCQYYSNCTSVRSWGCCLKDMIDLQICLELHILGFGFPNDWFVMIYPYDPLSDKIVCNNHFYAPFLYGPAGFSSCLVGRPGF